jgi:Tol biopolymer transport system component
MPHSFAVRAFIAPVLIAAAACSDSGAPARVTVDRVVYSCFSGGAATGWDICAVDTTGSNRLAIIISLGDDGYPALSPDGSKLAHTQAGVLWTANADGSNPLQLGVNRPGQYPTWSPNGGRIAYANQGLWLIDPDGNNPLRIVHDSNGVDRPSWAPNGARIVFGTKSRFGGGKGIYAVNPDGTGMTALSTDPQDSFPSYSPDGTKIVYTVFDTGIAVMNADGTNKDTLVVSGSTGVASWSPDGQTIVYSALSNGLIKLWMMSATGANPRRLVTNSSYGERDPVWGTILR